MTITKTYKIPTMIVNGTVTETGLPEWANIALSGSELTSYLEADARQSAIMAPFIANGSYSYQDVIENGQTVSVNINFPSDTTIQNDSEWLSFWDRFRNDPNVTFPSDFNSTP